MRTLLGTLLQEWRLMVQRARDAWRLVAVRYRAALLVAIAIMAIGAWANAVIPVQLGDLATSMEKAGRAGKAWSIRDAEPYLVWIMLLFLTREIMQIVRRYLVHNACTHIEKDVTVRVIGHLLQLEFSALSQDRVGELHGKLRRSTEGLVQLLRLTFMESAPAVFTAIFAIVVAFRRNAEMGMIMVGIIPVAASLIVWQIMSQKGIRIDLMNTKNQVDGTVVELLGGIEYVRAANAERRETARVAEIAESVRAKEIKHHFAMSLFDAGKAVNEGLFQITIIGVAIILASQHRVPIGEIVTYAMLFGNVLAPLRDVHRILDECHESSLKAADLLDLLCQQADPSFGTPDQRRPPLQRGAPLFVVENLHVDYDAKGDHPRPALNGVTMTIRVGETIGLAGRSGSGKSTWLRAMLRLVHSTGGRIQIGGDDIRTVSREAISRLVAFVSQTPLLFAGTIADNIAYEMPEATPNAIRDAALRACIDEEIMDMPGGYGAWVSERGSNLSGGQRQRIALARAFLKNPPVFVIDEGTSALDTISERRIQLALDTARGDRTIIIVAHRLSTLRDTDRIFVFAKGTIAETGSYEELLQNDGVFAELARNAGLQPLPPAR